MPRPVVVVLAHLAADIAAEAIGMTAFEQFFTEKVREARTILGLYPATENQALRELENWRKAHKR